MITTGRLRGVPHVFVGAEPGSSPSVAPPQPQISSAWRQIGIGVAVVLISAALIGVTTRALARPVSP